MAQQTVYPFLYTVFLLSLKKVVIFKQNTVNKMQHKGAAQKFTAFCFYFLFLFFSSFFSCLFYCLALISEFIYFILIPVSFFLLCNIFTSFLAFLNFLLQFSVSQPKYHSFSCDLINISLSSILSSSRNSLSSLSTYISLLRLFFIFLPFSLPLACLPFSLSLCWRRRADDQMLKEFLLMPR